MGPRFNEPLYNEVLGITSDILQPGQLSYSKMYGTAPLYNEPRCNEIFVITNTIEKSKRQIYPNIRINVITRQKMNAKQTNRDENPLGADYMTIFSPG